MVGVEALAAESADAGGDAGPPATTCNAALLTRIAPSLAEQSCEGGWEYERWGTCTARHESCPSACIEAYTCAHWSFGPDATNDNQSSIHDVQQAYRMIDGECREGPGGRVTCTKPRKVPDGPSPAQQCNDLRTTLDQSVKQGIPAAYHGLVSTTSSLTFYDVEKSKGRCSLSSSYPRPKVAKGEVCGCKTMGKALCTGTSPLCGASGVRVLSAPGLKRKELQGADPLAAVEGPGSVAPRCTTCEDLPMSTPAEQREKARCLERSWTNAASVGGAPAGSSAPLPNRPAVARSLRLLGELVGDHVGKKERAAIDEAYLLEPEAEHSCSETAAAPAIPIDPACPDPKAPELSALVDKCGHLALIHAPDRNAAIDFLACVEALTRANDLAETGTDALCSGPALRRAAFEATSTMLWKALNLGAVADSPDALTALPRVLFGVDVWYEQGARRYALDGLPLVAPRDATGAVQTTPSDAGAASAVRPFDTVASEMFGKVWAQLFERSRVLADLANAADPKAAIQQATERGLALDRQILKTALTPVTSFPAIEEDGVEIVPASKVNRPPLSGRPLLYVTGDALSSLSRRLDALRSFHDFACQFVGCTGSTRTPVTSLLGFLAAIPSKAALDAQLQKTEGDPLDGWREVFGTMRENYTYLDTAIAKETTSPTWFEDSADGLSAPLRPLAEPIGGARARIKAYGATGLLDAMERRVLHAGVNDVQRDFVTGRLETSIATIDGAARDYELKLDKTIAGLVAKVGNEQALGAIRNERKLLDKRIGELRGNLEGLQALAAADQGTVLEAYERIKASVDESALMRTGSPSKVEFRVSGKSARYAGPIGERVTNIHDVGLTAQQPLELARGTRVIVGVEEGDEWSPTCALRKTGTYAASEGGLVRRAYPVDGVLVGPEGFRIEVSAQGFSTKSSTDTTTASASLTIGTRLEGCGGAMAGGSGTQACVYMDAHAGWGWENSESETTGFTGNMTASYERGARLAAAPFPELPAGSLLAFVMPRNVVDPKYALDVQVVRSTGTVVSIPEDATLYFVANDRQCEEADASHELRVHASTLVPFAEVAIATVKAIDTVRASLDQKKDGYVAAGSLLPNAAQAERSMALQLWQEALVAAGVQTPTSALPSPIQVLFQASLDREIARIERAVEMAAVNRSLDQLHMQRQALLDDERATAQGGRLAELVPAWSLRNADGDLVRDRTAALLDDARRYLYPMLELWYPGALTEIRRMTGTNEVRARLDTLLSRSVDAWLLDLVGDATRTLGLIVQTFTQAPLGDPQGQFRPFLAVSFPKPDDGVRATLPDPLNIALSSELSKSELACHPAADMDAPSDPTDVAQAKAQRRAQRWAGTRAKALWSALENHEKVRVQILPSDVYRAGGVGGTISCARAVPVVRQLAVVVLSSDRSASADQNLAKYNQYRWLAGSSSTTQPFVTEQGVSSFTLANPKWQSFEMPLIYASADRPLDAFRTLVVGDPARPDGPVGLSPFGELEIDFGGMSRYAGTSAGEGLETAQEIAIVMQVDTRLTTSVPVASCSQPPPAACPTPSSTPPPTTTTPSPPPSPSPGPTTPPPGPESPF